MPLIIDDPAYECLRGYAVFAGTGGIAFNNTAGTILTGGVYGAHDGTSSVAITGKVNDGLGGGSVTVTQGNNLAGDSRARGELQILGPVLGTLTEDYTTLGGVTNGSGGFDYTFEPGVYLPTIGDINFTANDQIVFVNTANTTDPQWIFIMGNVEFTGHQSIVYGPASGKQIYWVANTVTVDATTTATLKGVFLASGPITFEGDRNLEPGAAYSFDAITFSQPATMTGFGYAAICFLEDTPINTDQGILRIDKIVAGVNTINNKRIVAVTKTIDGNTFLVCFKKDSLGENIPSQDTITSRHHAVEYNGEMLEARHFLDKFDNVVKVEYNGETLYNILMDEHAKITVNNLVCETLNPDHPYSQKYKKPVVNM